MISNSIGMLHLISSIATLVLGSWVIFAQKGTRLHKQMGYAYCIAMIAVNATAFSIYRLFNGFGPFHIAALISSITLVLGMIPVLFRQQIKQWVVWHFSFMYYSVIGLYAAFVSETMVRIPVIRFWWSVALGTFLVMFLGIYFFQQQSVKWKKQFNQNSNQ